MTDTSKAQVGMVATFNNLHLVCAGQGDGVMTSKIRMTLWQEFPTLYALGSSEYKTWGCKITLWKTCIRFMKNRATVRESIRWRRLIDRNSELGKLFVQYINNRYNKSFHQLASLISIWNTATVMCQTEIRISHWQGRPRLVIFWCSHYRKIWWIHWQPQNLWSS